MEYIFIELKAYMYWFIAYHIFLLSFSNLNDEYDV